MSITWHLYFYLTVADLPDLSLQHGATQTWLIVQEMDLYYCFVFFLIVGSKI